jgi:hypothetical protein
MTNMKLKRREHGLKDGQNGYESGKRDTKTV